MTRYDFKSESRHCCIHNLNKNNETFFKITGKNWIYPHENEKK